MKILEFASIKHERVKGNDIFEVTILNQSEIYFPSMQESMKFIKSHAAVMMLTGSTNILSIKTTNLKQRIHYIIIEFTSPQEDPIVYEQTNFEYMRSHRYAFPRYSRRRVIDDRNYSYSDIIRHGVNWPPYYNIFLIVIAFLALITSSLLLISGLDLLVITRKDASTLSQLWWIDDLLFLPLVLSFVFFIYVWWTTYHSRQEILKSTGDYQEIDWLKWYFRRKIFLGISSVVTLAPITLLSWYLYSIIDINHANLFSVMLFISLSLWSIAFLSLTNQYINTQSKIISSLKEYYGKKSYRGFRAWIKNDHADDGRRTDESSFVFKSILSQELSRKRIQSSRELMESMDQADIKLFKEKNYEDNQWAIKEYFKLLKENDVRKHFSENNQEENNS